MLGLSERPLCVGHCYLLRLDSCRAGARMAQRAVVVSCPLRLALEEAVMGALHADG